MGGRHFVVGWDWGCWAFWGSMSICLHAIINRTSASTMFKITITRCRSSHPALTVFPMFLRKFIKKYIRFIMSIAIKLAITSNLKIPALSIFASMDEEKFSPPAKVITTAAKIPRMVMYCVLDFSSSLDSLDSSFDNF